MDACVMAYTPLISVLSSLLDGGVNTLVYLIEACAASRRKEQCKS